MARIKSLFLGTKMSKEEGKRLSCLAFFRSIWILRRGFFLYVSSKGASPFWFDLLFHIYPTHIFSSIKEILYTFHFSSPFLEFVLATSVYRHRCLLGSFSRCSGMDMGNIVGGVLLF
jgi:hypothetical protein